MRAIRRYGYPLTASEDFNGSTSGINFGTPASQDSGAAATYIALIYPTGSGEGGSSQLWSKVPSGSNDGPTFNIQDNTGTPGLQFRQGSTGSSGFPARNGANSTVTYNQWNLVAAVFDGSLTGANIKLYNGINGATIAETTYGAAANGTGSLRTGSGNTMFVGDRAGTDRSHLGSIAYIARYNTNLSLSNLQTIQTRGPAAFYSNCTFLWSNGRDYGPNALTGTGTNITSGTTPSVNNLLGFTGHLIGGRLAA